MKKLFRGILLGLGILIMFASGLCSLIITIGGIGEALKDPGMFLLPLMFGGIPFVIGLAMFLAGRSILRQVEAENALPRAAPTNPS